MSPNEQQHMAATPEKALLDRLGSPRAEVREQALGELRVASIERFGSVAQQHNKRGLRLGLTIVATLTLVLLSVVPVLSAMQDSEIPDVRLASLLAFAFTCGYFAVRCHRHSRAGRLLSQSRVERVEQGGNAGFQQLTEALDSLWSAILEASNGNYNRYRAIYSGGREMMIRELSALTPDLAILLSDSQRSALRYLTGQPTGFFKYGHIDVGLAAMRGLALTNDAQSLALVQKFANEPPITANMKRVRQAATEHLKWMQARRAEQERETTLLRASSEPTEPQVLLMPAQNPGGTPGDELLRPR